MKHLVILGVLALSAAACATDGNTNTQYAKRDCKVAPITTASVAGGKTRPPTSLEQRQAEMALGTSEYRQRELNRVGRFGNNVEEALYDCP
jgi:hypothetical protein